MISIWIIFIYANFIRIHTHSKHTPSHPHTHSHIHPHVIQMHSAVRASVCAAGCIIKTTPLIDRVVFPALADSSTRRRLPKSDYGITWNSCSATGGASTDGVAPEEVELRVVSSTSRAWGSTRRAESMRTARTPTASVRTFERDSWQWAAAGRRHRETDGRTACGMGGVGCAWV